MQAVVVREFGQIESLLMEERPDPVPGRDEVLVDIRAVAANFVDLLVISGRYQFLPAETLYPGQAAGRRRDTTGHRCRRVARR